MRYWLMKSEPTEVSIDDVATSPTRVVPWFGVRNFQARNFMRDDMRVNDLAFFYHSSCAEPGVAGIVKIVSAAYPDSSQYDSNSKYYDAKATRETPRWFNVDVEYVQKIDLIPLQELRRHPELAEMRLLAKGSRLSITPVAANEWRFIETLMGVIPRTRKDA